MLNIKDSRAIIKNEYGKNLSLLLILDIEEKVDEYVDFFVDLFKNVLICEDYESGEFFWNSSRKNYDMVIVHIDQEAQKAKELIQKIRDEDPSIYIMVFSSDGDSTYHKSEHCYCADANIPYPFDEEYSSKYLYRFLKRISDLKDLEAYVKVLESDLQPHEKNVVVEEFTKTKKVDENRLRNIRFNQPDKITAEEFVESLDVTIVDKIENFQEDLDKYMITLYDMDEAKGDLAMEKLRNVIKTLDEFSYIVGNMVMFPIIEQSFKDLGAFLGSLDEKSFENDEQKKLLTEILLGVGKDLELWINTIFIEKNTKDIHYFDASFANSCVEIEGIFHNDNLEAEDDGELEFF